MVKNEVVSKYFFRKSVMDDSLSDFKEKKNIAGSKNQKPSVSQKKQKIKKLKGQKDIRSVLRSKKSELLKYNKDFNDVCIQSGLDIDSEQLQIAIALSKSLVAESDTSSNTSENTTSQNSQDRVAKIRRTLIEYGFKVPEIKISKAKGKKGKADYKLLLTTESEKQQIIADKYSQVLFEPISKAELVDTKHLLDDKNKLYYFTTHVSYELIKDNRTFYIESLVEKSTNAIGSLLKNWSLIPGRPPSPIKQEYCNMFFNKTDHSQSERDTILSGTLKNINKLLKPKLNKNEQTKKNTELSSPNYDMIPSPSASAAKKNIQISQKYDDNTSSKQRCRSASPDLFEDEISIAININKDTNSQQAVDLSSVCMELTSYPDNSPISNANCDGLTQVNSQDITKRRSNDPMEITECVATSSQPLFVNVDVEKVTFSLTDPIINPFKDVKSYYQPDIVGSEINPLDYIASLKKEDNDCNKLDNLESDDVVIHSPDTIIIDLCDMDKNYNNLNPLCEIVSEDKACAVIENNNSSIDLTQYSDFNDSLPLVPLNGKKKKRPHKNQIEASTSASDIIIIDSDLTKEIIQINRTEKKERLVKSLDSIPVSEEIDLTQPILNKAINTCEGLNLDLTQPTANDLINISNNSNRKSVDEVDLIFQSNKSNSIYNRSYDSIQESDEEAILLPQPSYSKNLGKENDISIDYDDMSDIDTIIADITSENHVVNNSDNELSNFDKESSQQSEEFVVSDNEFNYSIKKSNHNFDLGGLSIMDDSSNVQNDKSGKKKSLDIDHNSNTSETVELRTPVKEQNTSFRTPPTSDYVIKTGEVTPMLDYASMSTEERNKELDKYGLKPFKRKRAIQLLTYIYNQMHPTVESYSEEPLTKKTKHNTHSDISSKNNLNINDHENGVPNLDIDNIYEVTNETPEINYIECDADDWVFQKREKSKVHSCRVPLHVAFHNYVSCRRLLREAILRYEPVNIAVIHKQLVGYGHRYDPKDLLKFMDKKCITVKTLDKSRSR